MLLAVCVNFAVMVLAHAMSEFPHPIPPLACCVDFLADPPAMHVVVRAAVPAGYACWARAVPVPTERPGRGTDGRVARYGLPEALNFYARRSRAM